jgi:hypothetical protein
MREYHPTKEDKAKKFVGHSKAVTCLSASIDGVTLLSGSLDTEVMLWHIPSRQCIRVFHHKGPVTNAFFTVAPKCIFSEDMKPTLVLCSFQKSLDPNEGTVAINIRATQDNWHTVYEDDVYYYNKSDCIPVTSNIAEDDRLLEQIASLKKVNSDLFGYAVEKTVEPFSIVQVKDMKSNMSRSTQPAASRREMKAKKLKKVNKKKSKNLEV